VKDDTVSSNLEKGSARKDEPAMVGHTYSRRAATRLQVQQPTAQVYCLVDWRRPQTQEKPT
jgi:hypothetical protein